jgi:hypothetical protein
MPIIVKFHATRTNTDHEFFWESTDPEVSSVCDAVKNLADVSEVAHNFTKLEDNLNAVSTFILPTYDYWTGFSGLLRFSIPNALEVRDNYFNNAGHVLTMEIRDVDTAELIHVQSMIPAA